MRRPSAGIPFVGAACCAVLLAALGCGDNGSSSAPTSGRSALRLTAIGMPIFLGAPYYEFDFSKGEMVTGTIEDGAGGDLSFVDTGLFYLGTQLDGGIVDLGTVDLDSVSEAPETGYASSVHFGDEVWRDWSLLVGRTFCVRTRDGAHYAKMKIVEADGSANTITFDWVYLPGGGRVFP